MKNTFTENDIGSDGMPLILADPGPIMLYYTITFGIIAASVAWLLWVLPSGLYSDSFVNLACWTNIIWGGVGFSHALRRQGYSMLTMTYVFHLTFFGLMPFLCYRSGLWLWGDISEANLSSIRYALICTQVFMLFTLVGARFCPKILRYSGVRWWSKRTIILDHLNLALGLQFLCLIVFTYYFGGEALLLRSVEFSSTVGKAPSVILGLFIRPLMLFLGLFALYAVRNAKTSPAQKFGVGLICGIGLIANLPISTSRYYTIFAITATLFAFYCRLRRKPIVIMGYIYLGYIGSPIADRFRDFTTISDLGTLTNSKIYTADYIFIGHFDAFEMLVYTVSYVGEKGIVWGSQLLGAVLFWVPRQLWEGKPVSTGEMLASDYIGLSRSLLNTNISGPMPAEGFINFGMPGVIVFGLVYGCFVIWMDQLAEVPLRRQDLSGAGFAASVFLPSLAALSLILQRGTLIVALSSFCGIILSCWVASLFFLRRVR